MTERTLSLGLALSSRDWRPTLHRHCRDHEASVAVTLLRDGRDAFDAPIDVVIVDDETSWLAAPFVAKARDAGIGLIGIFDPLEADGHGLEFLRQLGIEMVAPAETSTDDLLRVAHRARTNRSVNERFAELVGPQSHRVEASERHVIVVGGPAGSGATEVSVALSHLVAQQRSRPLLIDVDETHPSLARRLGLGIHPHILTASEHIRGEHAGIDHIEQAGSPAALRAGSPSVQPLTECLARPALGQRGFPFDTIVGLAARGDWSLLRPDDALDLVDEAAAQWPVVIARIGPQLEDLSRHVDRYGISRAVAGRADHVVGVCEATSTGVLRFVDWLVDALGVVGETPIDLVLNRCPRSSQITGQITDQLRSIIGDRIGVIVEAPYDKRVERAAWDAQLVGPSPFTKALGPMAERVLCAEGALV